MPQKVVAVYCTIACCTQLVAKGHAVASMQHDITVFPIPLLLSMMPWSLLHYIITIIIDLKLMC